MGRKIVMVLVLLVMMAVQILAPARARAANSGQIALFAGIGAAAFVAVALIGTKLVYPEKIHFLVPQPPEERASRARPGGLRLGPQCGPPPESGTGESLPLFCW